MKQFNPWLNEQKHIKSRTDAYASQRMNFKHGRRLGDIYIYDHTTCKKVRRILEKRVAQGLLEKRLAEKPFHEPGAL